MLFISALRKFLPARLAAERSPHEKTVIQRKMVMTKILATATRGADLGSRAVISVPLLSTACCFPFAGVSSSPGHSLVDQPLLHTTAPLPLFPVTHLGTLRFPVPTTLAPMDLETLLLKGRNSTTHVPLNRDCPGKKSHTWQG